LILDVPEQKQMVLLVDSSYKRVVFIVEL